MFKNIICKKFYSLIFSIFLFSLLFLFLFTIIIPVNLSFAKTWIDLNSNSINNLKSSASPSVSPIELNVQKNSLDEITLEYHVSGFFTEKEIINGQEYQKISIPNTTEIMSYGHPALLKYNRDIVIDNTGNYEVEIISNEESTLQIGKIIPSKGDFTRNIDPSKIPYQFSRTYSNDHFYPATQVELSNPFILRSVRGITVKFYPLQYNPITNSLKISKHMVVKIYKSPRNTNTNTNTYKYNEANELQSNYPPINALFDGIYNKHFLNYKDFYININKSNIPSPYAHDLTEIGKMLIITHDSFYQSIYPLYLWKIQKGIPTKLVKLSQITGRFDAINSNIINRTNKINKTNKIEDQSTKIKNYIQNAYNSEGISFILLVGDAEFIPYMVGTDGNVQGNEADPMYGLLAGNDSYPDAIVSRLSAKNSSDVENQVAKIINYEKFPAINTDWYSNAAGIASNEGTPSDKERMEILATILSGWHYKNFTRIYDPGATPANVASAVNTGTGFINYTGHGSKTSWGTSSFSNSDIDALTNGNKLPFIVSVACVNGQFASGEDCFAERWLKAGSKDNPKGAMAIFASSTNQSWVPPTVGQKKISELLVAGEKNTIGGLFFNGSIAVLEDNSDSAIQTFQSWHIFGDGQVQVRTVMPTLIHPEHPKVLYTNESSIKISGLSKGTLCALSSLSSTSSADPILVGSAYASADGIAEINFNNTIANFDKLTLTITDFDKIPYTSIIDVVTPFNAEIIPNTLDMKSLLSGPQNVFVKLTDLNGSPVSNTPIWIEGFGYSSDKTTTTSSDGTAKISVNYQFAGELTLKIIHSNRAFELTKIAITGAENFNNVALSINNDILAPFLAYHFNNTITAEGSTAIEQLYIKTTDFEKIFPTNVAMFYPTSTSNLQIYSLAKGYAPYKLILPVKISKSSLKGLITDTNNNPLANATVELIYPSTNQVILSSNSANDGTFALASEFDTDIYNISIKKFGYLTQNIKSLLFKSGENTKSLQLPLSENAIFEGHVKLLANNIKATLTIYRTDNNELYKSIQTDDLGYFNVTLPRFNYQIYIRAKNARSLKYDLQLNNNISYDFNLEEAKGILIIDQSVTTSFPNIISRNGNSSTLKPLLEKLGYEVTIQNNLNTNYENWFDYKAVIYSHGTYWTNISLMNELQSFIAKGGKLFIEGGELAYIYKTNKDILEKFFHISSWVSDNCGNLSTTGINHPILNDPQKLPDQIKINYYNFYSEDCFIPINNNEVFAFGSSITNPSSNTSAVAVARDNSFVLFTVDFKTIDINIQKQMLQNIIKYLLPN